MEIDKLESRWGSLFGSVDDTDPVKKAFNDLTNRYSEKHRFYHSLEHITACLGTCTE